MNLKGKIGFEDSIFFSLLYSTYFASFFLFLRNEVTPEWNKEVVVIALISVAIMAAVLCLFSWNILFGKKEK